MLTSENNNTIYLAIQAVCQRQPDKVAIIFGEQTLTFAQLLHRIDGVALRLSELGISKGGVVAVFSQNRPEFLFCYFATAKLGGVFVPLNFNLTQAEVEFVLDHSDVKVLFHDDLVADLKELSFGGGTRHSIAELNSLSDNTAAVGLAAVDVDEDLLIAYTSGSTGMPKAVVLSNRAQLNAAASFKELFALSADDTTVLGAPLGFLLGLSTISMVSLLAGAKVVINRRFHPGEILEALVKNEATIFHGVPTMFSMMLEYAEQQNASYDLSKMRALICSGSPLLDELQNRFRSRFRKDLQNYFGMTECYPVFGRNWADAREPPRGSVGKVVPGAAVLVIDEQGDEHPIGSHGELLIKAPSMVKRYHKDPAQTEAAYRDGWFKTGDIGYQDESGYVYITGRIKDLIRRGGANVAPVEIENVLLRHPAVSGAAVIGVPDRIFAEVPVAYVVKKPGSTLSGEELVAFASQSLAKFKLPSGVYFTSELPLGKTGKVDKKALRAAWDRTVNLGSA
ncbi:class I adenylate-forming enzyme family protein [Rhizobium sp. NZLR11]|uniref:class I adenylate-forming enzyme family protein n=1 Tax=Rhizobium sp. NZLR11 TaxID=2731098 RepID=UPI001C83F011|nr:class I adenylate-forming enzyme family protein [Rhizobium sp. NZLR11]MBX5206761.1 acyl--CoA ligase [Rhizobium sp. NZLR11]